MLNCSLSFNKNYIFSNGNHLLGKCCFSQSWNCSETFSFTWNFSSFWLKIKQSTKFRKLIVQRLSQSNLVSVGSMVSEEKIWIWIFFCIFGINQLKNNFIENIGMYCHVAVAKIWFHFDLSSNDKLKKFYF
jgi:hypothetical protein